MRLLSEMVNEIMKWWDGRLEMVWRDGEMVKKRKMIW